MKHTLAEIKNLVDSYAQKIEAPSSLLPTYGDWVYDAHPYIEVDKNGQLYLVVVERGKEIRRDFAIDIDDLLFRVFSFVTFDMASSFEVRNRIAGEDLRRQLFAKQVALMETLCEKWKERIQKEHDYILKYSPFDDKSSERVDYYMKLTQNGMPPTLAWQEALKKYP